MRRFSKARVRLDATLAVALTALLCALVAARPALTLAQEEASGSEQEAGARFDRGIELYGEGNLDAALVQFERAYELVPNYRVLYNLAQIQAERHEYVAARRLFQKYLDEGGVRVSEPRKAEAVEQLAKLQERIARLWVETNVAGAKLYVDDELVGTLPLSHHVLINSGVCHVRVEMPGYLPASSKLKVAGGDQPRLELPLSRVANAAQAGGSAAPSQRALAGNRAFWISSASAVALGGAALTVGLLARQANQELDAELNRLPARPEVLAQDRSRLKTYAALTDGLGGAALVALGFAVYFLVDPPAASAHRSELSVRKSMRLFVSDRRLGLYGTF